MILEINLNGAKSILLIWVKYKYDDETLEL